MFFGGSQRCESREKGLRLKGKPFTMARSLRVVVDLLTGLFDLGADAGAVEGFKARLGTSSQKLNT
jgi:hypothetical protein